MIGSSAAAPATAIVVTSSTPFWFITRATGLVALVLLTASMALGLLASVRYQSRGWPRFVTAGLHRNASVLACAFTGVHIVTTLADGFVPIRLQDVVIPFISAYRPVWLGLGAIAFDLMLALTGHISRYGPILPPGGGAELIAEVDRAGLAGRGGAGFPAARKMHAVAAATAGRKSGLLRADRGSVLVANGVESEPASSKDKMLLDRSPHLVLDGIALAAAATGASRAYLCLHDGYPGLAGQLRAAVNERERAGADRVPVQVTEIPGGYVASQETALISYLNGGPQRPSFVPPRPFERGVHGRPTLVQNVETLAHLALIARYGAAWFRGLGAPQSAGSALITVSGAVRQPSVLEIELGTRIGDLLERAGGPAEPPQAILAGGYFGGWLPYPAALDIRMTDADLRAAGAALGPGILVLLPESACGLAETARTIGYLAGQSAGQCGPCLNGLPALADAFDEVAFARPGRDTLGWVRQLLGLVAGRGACQLPDGTAALAASTLRVFDRDLRRHAASGPCPQAWRLPVLPEPADQDAAP